MATFSLVRRSAFGWGPSAAGYANPTKGLVVHYDGSDQGLASKPHSACITYWKNTRKFHMGPERGWADIGYSFGVCPHGYAFEGRGLNKQQAAQPGGNSTWYSCTFMTGDHERPTSAQIDAFRALRAWLRSKGVAAAISYHGKFISTSCPGSVLRDLVTSGKLAGAPSGSLPGGGSSDWMVELVNKLPTLGKGDKGEHVETLQALCQARSHPEVKINGTFDAVTETAVKALQRWGNLADDGIVGPKTWPVLLRVA